jgi:hypothetical protein
MLRVTGGVRGQCLLGRLSLILMSIPFPALANFKHLPTPVLDLELVPLCVSAKVSNRLSGSITYGSFVGADLPLVTGASPPIWSTDEREWQQYGKDRKHARAVKAFKDKKADSVYARLAEARIEGLKTQQPVAITPIIRRIPTIQLLDCRTLTEEEVCKGLMCTWEAARCHEATGNAGPTAAPPGEELPR